MYKINQSANDIHKLEVKTFTELGFKERDNLQEWIAKNPEVLGEELLIIQKEYDGFNDTNERLDLLAMDKSGGLVIIENKLDDTGRNVVWQALKYTSYCSTLNTTQIIRMYQDYLNKTANGEDAKESLLEFLEWEDEELLLNRNDQRIIFVANNYRKEVTSTVLWLLKHDVQIQCFRATPYSLNDELFLQIEQIIPLPETKEFMIDAQQKEKDEKGKSKAVEQTESRLIEFWSELKQGLNTDNFPIIERVTPRGSFSIGGWKGKGKFAFCIGRYSIRVELYFNNDSDKILFESMYRHKAEIEEKFNGEITWERLDGKKASRIKHEMPLDEFKMIEGSFNEKTNWEAWIDWYKVKMKEFYEVLYPIWEKQ